MFGLRIPKFFWYKRALGRNNVTTKRIVIDSMFNKTTKLTYTVWDKGYGRNK